MPFTPLSSSEHSDLRLTRGTFFHFQERAVIAVSVVEAPRAALDLPLAFAETQKGLSLVAVLSLKQGENAQIGPKGLWMGGYMPALIAAYPFAMVVKEGKATLVVDTDSDWLSRTEGQPLFEGGGNPSKGMNRIMDLLKNRVPNPNRDNPVLQAIEQSNILEPWSEVSENLLRVSPRKLPELDDQAFLGLRRKGALSVLYAQIMSTARVNRIQNLAKRKEQMAQNQPEDVDLDLDKLFGDDDLIKFD
ncbi:hypothetical protein AKJ60_00695 [candidate division MSBL1 archaeon SCGC-AAA385M11]|nr:hypothetical protein AKJ60_00695 [candidate division MSBL1 archaeon SCGC-AAA385M11]